MRRSTSTRWCRRRWSGGPVEVRAAVAADLRYRRQEEGASPAQITDELRIFNLLAEVRVYKRAGENWVTWYYPPSIREELVSPSRWAQVDFAVLRQLTTHRAVALYEICARYRDSPAGVTSRQHWSWWAESLRSLPTKGPRMAQVQERVCCARHQGDQRPRRHRDRVDRVQARP